MLDFPNAPTVGQKFPAPPLAGLPVYTWDGEKWTTVAGSPGSVGGSSQVYIGDTPPLGVADNSLWWESDTGILYVRYNDGNSTAWIQIPPTAVLDMSVVVAKAGDTMTGPLVLPGMPTLPLQAATKSYVDTALATSALVRSYLGGLNISMAGATTTFTVAPGVAADSTNSLMMVLNAAMSKTTAAWALGNGNGALDAGVITANAFYHVFLIRRVDTGAPDVLISASPTAPTLPSPYTMFRRIGAIRTNASGQWTPVNQRGDTFLYPTVFIDANAASIASAARTLLALTVPTGVQVEALFRGQAAGTNIAVIFTSPDDNDQVANAATGGGISVRSTAAADSQSGHFSIRTNTAGQIGYRGTTNAGSLYIATYGYIDRRGKDD